MDKSEFKLHRIDEKCQRPLLPSQPLIRAKTWKKRLSFADYVKRRKSGKLRNPPVAIKTEDLSSSPHEEHQLLREFQLSQSLSGTLVQCSNPRCQRYTFSNTIGDPCQVPEFWTCSMAEDPDVQMSEDWTVSAKFVRTPYTIGSLVWAKSQRYPWWPAMVDFCVDENEYLWWDRETSDMPDQYHVIFFVNGKVSRQWVTSRENIRPFPRGCEVDTLKKKLKVNLKYKFLDSLSLANKMLSLSLLERLRNYSFLKLFSGKWSLSSPTKALKASSAPIVPALTKTSDTIPIRQVAAETSVQNKSGPSAEFSDVPKEVKEETSNIGCSSSLEILSDDLGFKIVSVESVDLKSSEKQVVIRNDSEYSRPPLTAQMLVILSIQNIIKGSQSKVKKDLLVTYICFNFPFFEHKIGLLKDLLDKIIPKDQTFLGCISKDSLTEAWPTLKKTLGENREECKRSMRKPYLLDLFVSKCIPCEQKEKRSFLTPKMSKLAVCLITYSFIRYGRKKPVAVSTIDLKIAIMAVFPAFTNEALNGEEWASPLNQNPKTYFNAENLQRVTKGFKKLENTAEKYVFSKQLFCEIVAILLEERKILLEEKGSKVEKDTVSAALKESNNIQAGLKRSECAPPESKQPELKRLDDNTVLPGLRKSGNVQQGQEKSKEIAPGLKTAAKVQQRQEKSKEIAPGLKKTVNVQQEQEKSKEIAPGLKKTVNVQQRQEKLKESAPRLKKTVNVQQEKSKKIAPGLIKSVNVQNGQEKSKEIDPGLKTSNTVLLRPKKTYKISPKGRKTIETCKKDFEEAKQNSRGKPKEILKVKMFANMKKGATGGKKRTAGADLNNSIVEKEGGEKNAEALETSAPPKKLRISARHINSDYLTLLAFALFSNEFPVNPSVDSAKVWLNAICNKSKGDWPRGLFFFFNIGLGRSENNLFVTSLELRASFKYVLQVKVLSQLKSNSGSFANVIAQDTLKIINATSTGWGRHFSEDEKTHYLQPPLAPHLLCFIAYCLLKELDCQKDIFLHEVVGIVQILFPFFAHAQNVEKLISMSRRFFDIEEATGIKKNVWTVCSSYEMNLLMCHELNFAMGSLPHSFWDTFCTWPDGILNCFRATSVWPQNCPQIDLVILMSILHNSQKFPAPTDNNDKSKFQYLVETLVKYFPMYCEHLCESTGLSYQEWKFVYEQNKIFKTFKSGSIQNVLDRNWLISKLKCLIVEKPLLMIQLSPFFHQFPEFPEIPEHFDPLADQINFNFKSYQYDESFSSKHEDFFPNSQARKQFNSCLESFKSNASSGCRESFENLKHFYSVINFEALKEQESVLQKKLNNWIYYEVAVTEQDPLSLVPFKPKL